MVLSQTRTCGLEQNITCKPIFVEFVAEKALTMLKCCATSSVTFFAKRDIFP